MAAKCRSRSCGVLLLVCVVTLVGLPLATVGDEATGTGTGSSVTTSCSPLPMAADLRQALSRLGAQTVEQCLSLNIPGMLWEVEQAVLLFTGGVREHCLASMQRLQQAAANVEAVAPVDDEDAMASSGEGRDALAAVCELPPRKPAEAGQRPNLELDVGGTTMKPLAEVLLAAQTMLAYVQLATGTLNDDAVKQRIDVLSGRRKEWLQRVLVLGVVEGYQQQLTNLQRVHNATATAIPICHYAFPQCSSQDASKPMPLLGNGTRTACYRWRATNVLLHPQTGRGSSNNLTRTFYWKFLDEQCREALPSAVSAQQLSSCFERATSGVCQGYPVFKCPGQLQKTDNPQHWVGRMYLHALQTSSGISSSNLSTMPPPCTFPCGVRCRDNTRIKDRDILVLRQLRLASFFVLFAFSVIGLIVAVCRPETAMQYPQRVTVYATIIVLLWSLHYLPMALVDVEQHLCNSDKTARMRGHTESVVCTFTFAMFYGLQIVFRCMAVFSAFSLWVMAHSLNPLTRISISRGAAIALEVTAVLVSLLLGAVGVGVLIGKDGIFPSVTAGHCTVFGKYFKPAVLYPTAVSIGLHVLILLAIVAEFVRDYRRGRKMRRYTANVTVHSERGPTMALRRAFCSSLLHLAWSGLMFWYMISLAFHGEKPTRPGSGGSSGFECSVATCGSSVCETPSSISDQFYPILLAFTVLCLVFGFMFPIMNMVASKDDVAGAPADRPKNQYTAIATAKQLSKNASVMSYEFPLPPTSPTTVSGSLSERQMTEI